MNNHRNFNVFDEDKHQREINKAIIENDIIVSYSSNTKLYETILNIASILVSKHNSILYISKYNNSIQDIENLATTIGLNNIISHLNEDISNNFNENILITNNKYEYQDTTPNLNKLNSYYKINDFYGNTGKNFYDFYELYLGCLSRLEDKNLKIDYDIQDTQNITKELYEEIISNINTLIKYNNDINSYNISSTNIIEIINKIKEENEDNFQNNLKKLIDYADKFTINLNKLYELVGIENKNVPFLNVINNCMILNSNLAYNKNYYAEAKKIYQLLLNLNNKSNKYYLTSFTEDYSIEINKIREHINTMDQLGIKRDILEHINLIELLNEYNESREIIQTSPLKGLLDDPNFFNDFNYFKREVTKMDVKTQKFYEIRDKFLLKTNKKTYDTQFIDDLFALTDAHDKKISSQKQITAHITSGIKDEDLIVKTCVNWLSEYYKLKKITDEVMPKLLVNYKDYKYYMVKDILDEYIQLKLSYDKLLNDDSKGKIIFGKYWNLTNIDLSKLEIIVNNIDKYNKLQDTKFFTDKTDEFLKSENFTQLKELILKLETLNQEIINIFNILNKNNIFSKNENITEAIIQDNNTFKNIKLLSENFGIIKIYQEYDKCYKKYDKYTENTIKQLKNGVDADSIIDLFKYNFSRNSINSIIADVSYENITNLEKEIYLRNETNKKLNVLDITKDTQVYAYNNIYQKDIKSLSNIDKLTKFKPFILTTLQEYNSNYTYDYIIIDMDTLEKKELYKIINNGKHFIFITKNTEKDKIDYIKKYLNITKIFNLHTHKNKNSEFKKQLIRLLKKEGYVIDKTTLSDNIIKIKNKDTDIYINFEKNIIQSYHLPKYTNWKIYNINLVKWYKNRKEEEKTLLETLKNNTQTNTIDKIELPTIKLMSKKATQTDLNPLQHDNFSKYPFIYENRTLFNKINNIIKTYNPAIEIIDTNNEIRYKNNEIKYYLIPHKRELTFTTTQIPLDIPKRDDIKLHINDNKLTFNIKSDKDIKQVEELLKRENSTQTIKKLINHIKTLENIKEEKQASKRIFRINKIVKIFELEQKETQIQITYITPQYANNKICYKTKKEYTNQQNIEKTIKTINKHYQKAQKNIKQKINNKRMEKIDKIENEIYKKQKQIHKKQEQIYKIQEKYGGSINDNTKTTR